MHIVTLSQGMVRADGQQLPAGQWLCDDINAFEIAACSDRGTAQIKPFEYRPPEMATIATSSGPRKILCIHLAGYGDMLMFEPALRAFKARCPQHTLHVACRERPRAVLDGTGLPDAWVDYPVPLAKIADYDGLVSFENLNETDPRGRTTHAIDLKAQLLGLTLSDTERLPRYVMAEDEKKFAAFAHPRPDPTRPRLAVQLRASAENRTYPAKQLAPILGYFYTHGWEILLCRNADDPRDQITVPPPFAHRVIDLGAAHLSFRQSCAVLATCDVLLAPDSSLMHVAGAIGLPCVALFGSTDWHHRTAYYPSVHAIQGHDDCPLAPCWYHPAGHWLFPRAQPCERTGICSTLASITKDRIVQKIEKLFAAAKNIPR